MSSWRDLLTQPLAIAEAGFDTLRTKLRRRLDADKPYRIVYYRGFGSAANVWLTGRVLRQKDLSTPSDRDTFWHNLLDSYQRFDTDTVAGATVRIDAFGQSHTTTSDHEGYFELTLVPPPDLSPGRVWFPVTYSLDGITQPGTDEAVKKDGYLLISPPFSQFGVISDIDDTVLVTGATSALQTAKLTFLGNAYTRLPFAGIAAFYRALQSGPVTTLFNPIYYVSNSPWNLYDLLVDFFRIQGVPKGPILLRDLSLTTLLKEKEARLAHKLGMIRRVLAVNPNLPFVLIGDSGQQDPEIYTEVVRENPGRILAIYIRDVSENQQRDEAIRALEQITETFKVPLLLVPDTVAAAEHAATLGLIDPDTLPEIRADRQSDTDQNGQ